MLIRNGVRKKQVYINDRRENRIKISNVYPGLIFHFLFFIFLRKSHIYKIHLEFIKNNG